MRLHDFEKALKQCFPYLEIRQRNFRNVAGVYDRANYLLRLNKGEISLYSWKDPIGHRHRGRMQALNILVNYRYLTHRQAEKIMWGFPVYDKHYHVNFQQK
jgi:hypothetical protein